MERFGQARSRGALLVDRFIVEKAKDLAENSTLRTSEPQMAGWLVSKD